MKITRGKVIKGITYFAAITTMVFMTALDSDSYVPLIVCGVCMAWIFLIYLANK